MKNCRGEGLAEAYEEMGEEFVSIEHEVNQLSTQLLAGAAYKKDAQGKIEHDALRRIYGVVKHYYKRDIVRDREEEDVMQWEYNPGKLNIDCCAEITSLMKIIGTKCPRGSEVSIVLVPTDTALSVMAAELIESYFDREDKAQKELIDTWLLDNHKKYHISISCRREAYIDNLRIFKPSAVGQENQDRTLEQEQGELYEEGLHNLLMRLLGSGNKEGVIYQEIKGADGKRNPNQAVILNISSGYKAISPLLTLVAQLEEELPMSLTYLYEDSEHLMEFGRLPMTLNWAIAEQYYLVLTEPKLLASHHTLTISKIKEKLEAFQLIKLTNKKKEAYTKTTLGKLFVKQVEERLPVGKKTLGLLWEYKIWEYYQVYCKEIYRHFHCSRSVDIEFVQDETNRPKGNEMDLLFEPQKTASIYHEIRENGQRVKDNNGNVNIPPPGFIAIEIKPLTGLRGKKKQFEKWTRRIKTHWANSQPAAIWLVVWSFLPEELVMEKVHDQQNSFKELAKVIKEVFVFDNPAKSTFPFYVYHFNAMTVLENKELITFMQHPLAHHHISPKLIFEEHFTQ